MCIYIYIAIMLYNFKLYQNILLYYAILYIISYYIVLCCIVLYYIVKYYTNHILYIYLFFNNSYKPLQATKTWEAYSASSLLAHSPG